ncbi:hypothetical protein NMY22_g14637 [Coprinellus aureogranulatus]|nr:hypothetical protein NMY22_g14637 [Coprinellus aureogranulatus]
MSPDRNDVAVFWDYISCPVPGEVTGYTVVQNIRSLALRFGNIKAFKAYLSIATQVMNDPFSGAPLQLRSQIQSSGVSVTDVPGGKDVADKMLIADMLAYAFDRPSHSTVIILISADPTLAYPLSLLRLRNHNVVVVKPRESKPDLSMQASLSFDWNEEIIQDPETTSEIVSKALSNLRILTERFGGGESVVDDRSPAPQHTPSVSSSRETTTAASHRLDEVVLEDYFPADRSSWHTLPDTREEKRPKNPSSYYPPTPDTAKTHKTPTGLHREFLVPPAAPSPPQAPFLSSEFDNSTRATSSRPSISRTLKQLKKKTPVGFRPLVEVLYNMREEGFDRPLRSSVGLQLVQKDPQVYERVGYTRFAQYASMAVTLGIAELGGRDGKAWISFHPSFDQADKGSFGFDRRDAFYDTQKTQGLSLFVSFMPLPSENVAIFWDYENCAIPANLTGYEAADAIRRVAKQFGSVTLFKAYLEVSEQVLSPRSMSLRSELQASGVSLTDCPHNGRKDVADKMILVDMLAYAIDHPPPTTFVLISGDRDFSYALSTLRLRRYRVALITPPNTHISLTTQASHHLLWTSDVLDASTNPPAKPNKKEPLSPTRVLPPPRVNFSSATPLSRRNTDTSFARDRMTATPTKGMLAPPSSGGSTDPEQTLVMGEGSKRRETRVRVRLGDRAQSGSMPSIAGNEVSQRPQSPKSPKREPATVTSFFGTPFRLPRTPPVPTRFETTFSQLTDKKGKAREPAPSFPLLQRPLSPRHGFTFAHTPRGPTPRSPSHPSYLPWVVGPKPSRTFWAAVVPDTGQALKVGIQLGMKHEAPQDLSIERMTTRVA